MFHMQGKCFEAVLISASLRFPCVCFTLSVIKGVGMLKLFVFQILTITQLRKMRGWQER